MPQQCIVCIVLSQSLHALSSGQVLCTAAYSAVTSSNASTGKEESKLRLQRKGSDGAVKKHRVVHTITNVPGVGVIEPGMSSHPHTAHAKSGSGLLTPEAVRKQKTELESSSGSEHSTVSGTNEGGAGKATPGLKKPSGGLKKPGGGFGFGPRSPKQTTSSSEEVGVAQDNKLANGGPEVKSPTPQKAANVERKSSFSKLSRFAAQSKLSHTPRASHPTQASHPSQASHTSHPAHASHLTQQPGGSNSSLDSTDIKLAVSAKLDSESTKVTTEQEELVKPAKLEIPETQSSAHSSTSELVSPPAEFKLTTNDETEESSTHPRFGRRISPEGMSHDDATSPRDLGDVTKETAAEEVKGLNRKNEELSETTLIKEVGVASTTGATTRTKKQSQPETGQTESPMLSQKQGQSSPLPVGGNPPPAVADDNRGLSQSERKSRVGEQELLRSPSHNKQRARSLSPKMSRRIIPTRVPVNFNNSGSAFEADRSGSSEDVVHSKGRSPLKSSLRGAGSKRHPSTSSSDSASSSSPSRVKVVISPRSSQVCGRVGWGWGGSYM